MEKKVLKCLLPNIIETPITLSPVITRDIISMFSNILIPISFKNMIEKIIIHISSNFRYYYSSYLLDILCEHIAIFIPLSILFNISIDIILPPTSDISIISTITLYSTNNEEYSVYTNISCKDEILNFPFDEDILSDYQSHINYILTYHNIIYKFKNLKYYYFHEKSDDYETNDL